MAVIIAAAFEPSKCLIAAITFAFVERTATAAFTLVHPCLALVSRLSNMAHHPGLDHRTLRPSQAQFQELADV